MMARRRRVGTVLAWLSMAAVFAIVGYVAVTYYTAFRGLREGVTRAIEQATPVTATTRVEPSTVATTPATTQATTSTTTTTLPEVVTDPPWRWAGNPDKVWGYLGEVSYARSDKTRNAQTQAYLGGIYIGMEEWAPVTLVPDTGETEVTPWVASFAFPNPNGGEDIVGRFALGFGATVGTQTVLFMATKTFGVNPNAYPGYVSWLRLTGSEIGQYMQKGELYFFIALKNIDIAENKSEEECATSPICSSVKYVSSLKRRLQGEDIELPENAFGMVGLLFLAPDQSEGWPPGNSPTG